MQLRHVREFRHDAEQGGRLWQEVQDCVEGNVEDYFPDCATSYATGRRDVDAEGCGPGMWLNALVIRHMVAAGFGVPMTGMLFATGNWQGYLSRDMLRLGKKNCQMMNEKAAKVLVVLLTAALYQSSPCLGEIATALGSKIKIVVLRCEDVRVGLDDMWPVPENLKGDKPAMQAYLLKRQQVVEFMASENSIPMPGNTILTLPSAMATIQD